MKDKKYIPNSLKKFVKERFFAEQNQSENKKNRKGILIVIGIIAGIFAITFLLKTITDARSANNSQIHAQLEVLEIQIKLHLKNKREAEALELIQQLNHPGNESMPDNGSVEAFLKGSPSYKFYWMEKKKYYANKLVD